MPNRRSILWATLASLLLHVAFVGSTWNVDFLGGGSDEPDPEEETEIRTVEFVLLPEPAEDGPGRPRESRASPRATPWTNPFRIRISWPSWTAAPPICSRTARRTPRRAPR